MSGVVEYFQASAPGILLRAAPKITVLRGLALFGEGAVDRFAYGPGGTLQATVYGAQEYLVEISVKDGHVEAACDCAAAQNYPGPCKHALAAMFTVGYLLRGATYGTKVDLSEEHAARLRGELKGEVSEVPPDERFVPWLLLDAERESGFGSAFEFHPGPTGLVPKHVRPLLSARWPEGAERRFLDWFETHKSAVPVRVRLDGLHEVVPESPVRLASAESVDLADDLVTLRRTVYEAGKGSRESSWHAIGDILFLDTVSKRLGIMGNAGGKGAGLDRITRSSIEDFGALCENWNEELLLRAISGEKVDVSKASFTLDGKPVQPAAGDASFAFALGIGSDSIAIRPEITLGGEKVPLVGAWAQWVSELAANSAFVAKLLSSKRRRAPFLALCAEVILAKEDAAADLVVEQFLAACPGEPPTFYRHVRSALAKLRASSKKTMRAVFACGNHHWVRPPKDIVSRVAAMWAAAQKATAGAASENPEETDYCLRVENDDLPSVLGVLSDQCNALGIALRWGDRPVQHASLDFSIEADFAGSGMDWFALAPEIRSNGEIIPPDKWQAILSRGTWQEDGELRIVSASDAAKLTLIRRLHDAAQAKNGTRDIPAAVPRLRILDLIELRRHGVRCKLPAEEEAIIESLVNHESIEIPPIPRTLQAELRDYQKAGYAWLAFLYRHRLGGCLADDMGLGKTVQTIALYAALAEGIIPPVGPREEIGPHLLVVPPTLMFNWSQEIARFCPSLRAATYAGSARSDSAFDADIVITSYDLVRRDLAKLATRSWHTATFDEAQAVKNYTGERARAVRRLQARFKLCLTGTPLENHAGEFHAILDLALPGLLGDPKEFRHDLEQAGVLDPLRRAAPFVLRRTKDAILKDLPPKTESDIYLDLDVRQRALYSRTVAEVRREVTEAFRTQTAAQAGITVLAALMRLRQVCISSALLDKENREESPKIEFLREQLEELRAEGYGALVFSSFTTALDLVGESLQAAGLAFLRMDGSTPTARRRALVESFQSGEGPSVFLISMKTGGAGLNLTRASHVFHLDPWWNPAVENQASDRAHRIGQRQAVFIHRLLMRHTVEEKMMELKRKKRELFDLVMTGSAPRGGAGTITKEDMEFLLGS